MNLGLKDKVAIVTGGAKGIGGAISQCLAQEGAKVVVCYRSDPEKCEEFIQSLRDKYGVPCIGVRGDVGSMETVTRIYDEAYKAFGTVDILVNNAGGAKTTAMVDMSLEEWENTLQSNITGMMYMSREFAKRKIAAGTPGRIVNVLSKVAMSTTSKNRTAYVSNKTAQLGLTRQLALDLVEHKIIVNGVLPGTVLTDLNRNMPNLPQKAARMPLGKLIDPEEVADTVAYLASDRAGAMVASIVDCTAGLLLGL